jgi:hypothetical protein
LPLPDSPLMSTGMSVVVTRSTILSIARIVSLSPTMSS